MKTKELSKIGLRPDRRWLDFEKVQPKVNDKVIIAFYKPGSVRQYAPITWTKDFDKSNGIIITNWYAMNHVYDINFPKYLTY